ncbi:uncharacterized protein LOC110068567 isoform X2 [Orbicella faveolata]|uniref:uncharacterized protein LOC110068567 isoform X2 n=1 Tax=Orbicella faveolata TaxID=48498 RepID=UPI0009E38D28|nr:uncharacterized protein LOC110068567 isoform X2 [Orbicella faveolata]
MAGLSTALIFLTMAITGYSMAEFITIERDSALVHVDFLLPDSHCPGNQPQCGNFNGTSLSICWCFCHDQQGKTTTFYESSYGCLPVSDVRQQAGCLMLFTGESVDQRLVFFPSDSVLEQTVDVPANQRCTFYYGNRFYVQYLDCTGSWRSIESPNLLDTIELTPGWSSSQLKIRIKAGTTLFQNVTAGRLVRVAIQCRSDTSNVQLTSSCVVFQVHGKIDCPYPRPTLAPALNAATLPTPVAERLDATGTLPPVTTPAKKPTTTPSTEEGATEPTKGATGDGTGTGEGAETGKRQESQKNTFIIAGSVAGGILLIALILLILWRCNTPKKRPNQHRRLEGSISSPVSHMSRNSIPVYTDASYLTPMGTFTERTRSMDNPAYRRSSDGIILSGSDIKRGSIYSDRFPTNAPPRPPAGSKRGSLNGQVNPALSLREEFVTMNPLYEGQVVDHKDLERLNCSDFGVSPDQVVLDTRKDPEEFNDSTYDCPEEILNSQPRASPIPMYYVLDEPYPDSITNTFGTTTRGRPDGHVYDEPEADLSRRRAYVVVDNPRGILYSHEYDEPPRDEELLSIRRLNSPSHGILKGGTGSPNNTRYYLPDDPKHVQVI